MVLVTPRMIYMILTWKNNNNNKELTGMLLKWSFSRENKKANVQSKVSQSSNQKDSADVPVSSKLYSSICKTTK